MQGDHSGTFNVESTTDVKLKDLHLFDNNTQIIKKGQRHQVIFGQMEEEKKNINEIITPYLYKFASSTADIALSTGNSIKTGILWVFNAIIHKFLPYAVEKLPKILFVTKKQQKQLHLNSTQFQVLQMQEEDYAQIKKNEKGKTRVVIPLGTQNDSHFQDYLRKENYQINHSFQIDMESDDNINVRQSFMIPSQSFEFINEQVKEKQIQKQTQQLSVKTEMLNINNVENNKKQQITQLEKKNTQQGNVSTQRVAYKLQNYLIIEFEGKNSVQYDMLDSIERNQYATAGYIVVPQQTLRKNAEKQKYDKIGNFINELQKEQQWIIHNYNEEKKVDNERHVKVDITNRKSKSQAELMLN